jgi:tRNA threonylcarbamoyladenosine biosynthesis protein TsaE
MLIGITNESDTERLARTVADAIEGGRVSLPLSLALNGGLGTGKTTFTRYLCERLRTRESASSPTFVLQHEYFGESIRVEHWDLYRLSAPPPDLFDPPEKRTLRLLEWCGKFPEVQDTCELVLAFEYRIEGADVVRSVRVSGKYAPQISEIWGASGS